jgi:hypothetical protein
MVTLKDFLNEEGNIFTKNLLLQTIERVNNSSMEEEEITLNVYSVTTFPRKMKS